jgi:hypothetical protein
VAHFKFTIDGTLTGQTRGDGQMLLISRNSSSPFENLDMRIDFGISSVDVYLSGSGGYVYLPAGSVFNLPPEITVSATGLTVSALDVIIDVPFTYGVDFDLSVLLGTVAQPGPSPDPSEPPSVFNSDFFSTAKTVARKSSSPRVPTPCTTATAYISLRSKPSCPRPELLSCSVVG